MAEITAKLIFYRLNETLTNMADAILSYFYIDSDVGEQRTFNWLNMFLAGWVLLGIFVYLLGTFVASILESSRENTPKNDTEKSVDNDQEVSKSSISNVTQAKPNDEKKTAATKARGVAVAEEVIVPRTLEEVSGAPRIGALSKVPVAEGKNAGSVKWINLILVWFHTTPKIELLIECWLHSINERADKIAAESGGNVVVTFEKLLPASPVPELKDVKVGGESSNNVTATAKIIAKQLGFDLLVSRNKSATKYLLNLEELDGKLKVTCNTEDQLLVVKFVEKPNVKLNLKLLDNGSLKESALDQRAFEDSVTDIAVEALATTIVDLHLSQDPDFPVYVRDKGSISPSSFGSANDGELLVARHEQRLFVKVIKASNLGGDKGCQEAYCVVEMDDPPQKFQTASIKATISPFWDEHFLFNLKNSSAEVLFEVYDKSKPAGENFLGLGIVSVEELLKNPSQRQIITLQSRPLENDKVTGSLTAEFLFMEGSEIPIRQQAGRTVETNSRVTPAGKIITTTTIKKSPELEDAINDSEPLTDTALKEIEQMGKTSGMSTNKSTLIIHSVQREVVRPTLKVKVDKDGRWHEVPAPEANGDHSGSVSPSSPTAKPPSAPGSASSSDKDDRSGRTKERKSFMGTLRKRLSFKKNRSKSVDPNGQDGQQSPSGSRSASNDRSKSAPGSREQSAGRHPTGNLVVPGGGSTRSSISEGSGFSGASSRTYINENSTLVIEINENGITKHYLIPFSLASRSKWRKRGVKLHIYNDHTFVAKHVPGSIMCQVCTRHFPRRPGKQAYSCRDCDLQVHKTCHVKVEGMCPNSTIQSLEMEYVQDPRVKSTSS